MSDCRLSVFPKELAALSGLVWLDMSNNQIESIPGVVLKDLHGLRQLRLENNRLTSLPTQMVCLTALHHLALQNNSLPDCFNVETALLEPVQAQLSDIYDFYHRVEVTRLAIFHFCLVYKLKRKDWR